MIYLDYQATTPLAPEARDAMLQWLDGPGGSGFGNPHSPHRMGRQAAAAVELARDRVAALFPAGGRVIFTGGATEAINLAIRGSGTGGSVSYSAIEHAAVIDTAEDAGKAHVLNVAKNGQCNTKQDLPADTRLVCLMQVNNEIGTIQPTVEWHRKAKESNALYLCDAVQAYGKMEVTGADMIAVSAHKLHGPKGIGALWVRSGLDIGEVQTGGGQEDGLRSGTLSPALCAGFGAAALEAKERMERDAEHVANLWNRAVQLFDGWQLNGSAEARYHGNLNIRRKRLDVNRLMSECRDVMFSAGSACASGSGRTSHVLDAIGLSKKQAKSSIRLGWGRYTTMEELEKAAEQINAAAKAQGVLEQ
ncbi:cysteine desulfurase family protein [Qipengyuania atrilutea]|uniref:Cysteine desulfurase n=1 Tax=Qipengyuania atrilutea TaxID=2744473 RepID=A0A850H163_9SPHN|nr:cysteine desulfurase family protein [Actirhodobacter atriluteus]NVD45694.1 cysteine desulfurase [Actirhodobacter atriluteus]